MHRQMTATRTALRRNRAARNRCQAARARHDVRTWQVERRKRTRHLIELGGLVVKAELINLIGDDRATMLGALLWIAASSKASASAVVSKGKASVGGGPDGTQGDRSIQQLVVEPRQWYVNYAKTDGCKRALNWRPTLPLQRRHKCGQRRRVTRL